MMKNYRFILDKSSKKFNCPRCGKKRFVKMIDSLTGQYLSDEFGRCDRDESCQYFKIPEAQSEFFFFIEFLSVRSFSKKSFRSVDKDGVIHYIPKSIIKEIKDEVLLLPEWYLIKKDISFNGCNFKEFKKENKSGFILVNESPQTQSKKTEKITFHSPDLLNDLMSKSVEDNLTKFLKSFFSAEEVDKIKKDYFLMGTDLKWKNSTLFLQLDKQKVFRSGKIMLYNCDSGKRVKSLKNYVSWLHSALKIQDFEVNQCLFGLHLSEEYPDKDIAIVESEKTAVILSLVIKDFIWMATGGSGNLKLERLSPIKDRRIILYPDKGVFDDWKKVESEAKENGFRISTSDILENTSLNDGDDLADFYLMDLSENNQNEKIDESPNQKTDKLERTQKEDVFLEPYTGYSEAELIQMIMRATGRDESKARSGIKFLLDRKIIDVSMYGQFHLFDSTPF